MLSAVSSKDIKPLQKARGREKSIHGLQGITNKGNHAMHMPKHDKKLDKADTNVVKNNEDIMNLLAPNVP